MADRTRPNAKPTKAPVPAKVLEHLKRAERIEQQLKAMLPIVAATILDSLDWPVTPDGGVDVRAAAVHVEKHLRQAYSHAGNLHRELRWFVERFQEGGSL